MSSSMLSLPSSVAATTSVRRQLVDVNDDIHTNLNNIFDGDRIVGGFNAAYDSFPWNAAPIVGQGFVCGAMLIAPDVLLSAAHCSDPPIGGFTGVTLGLGGNVRQTGQTNYTQLVRVERELRHPEYTDYPANANDIVLLKLTEPVDMSDPKISLVDWNRVASTPAIGTDVTAIGYGRLSFQGSLPAMLQQVDGLEILSESKCRDAYGPRIRDEFHVCARTSGADTCNGDSGGPILQDNVIVGITSFGSGCADTDFPGVYTRISEYTEFISNGLCFLESVSTVAGPSGTTSVPTAVNSQPPTNSPSFLPTAPSATTTSSMPSTFAPTPSAAPTPTNAPAATPTDGNRRRLQTDNRLVCQRASVLNDYFTDFSRGPFLEELPDGDPLDHCAEIYWDSFSERLSCNTRSFIRSIVNFITTYIFFFL